MTTQLTPCLWFDRQAEEAANHYCGIFKNSNIGDISHYGDGAPMPKGTVLTVKFRLDGKDFMALNGGPMFKFSEATSFVINCKDQQEVDYYWARLCEGGSSGRCGWLKDKYGLSWQVVPTALPKLMQGEHAGRVMQALMQMDKLDIKTLQDAARPEQHT